MVVENRFFRSKRTRRTLKKKKGRTTAGIQYEISGGNAEAESEPGKSRTVSVFAIRNFKYLGFCFGKNGKGIYIRIHGKPWKKAKEKLRRLTSRSRCGSIIGTMEKIEVYMRGWLNDYGIADMKNNMEKLNGWLYRRIRMCIWKQWKLPKTRKRKLMGLGLPEWAACEGAYSRKAYWRMAGSGVVQRALTKERLINWGYYDIATAYQSVHINY